MTSTQVGPQTDDTRSSGFATLTRAVLGLFVGALAAAAIATSAGATPLGSQQLRGMAGRSFAVHVTAPGIAFENCYRFETNGDWYDQVLSSFFPGVLGRWHQDPNGARTPYTATVDLGSHGNLVQTGIATPAQGAGTLQLSATTLVPAGILGPSEVTLAAAGSEVASC